MVAGQPVEIGSQSVRRTLSAFRLPGTETISLGILKSVRMVRVRACSGTSSSVLNQPSATCCWRQAVSRLTTRMTSEQWNLTLEQQVSSSQVLRLAYEDENADHQFGSVEGNAAVYSPAKVLR
jgi:hypothetical protein